MAGFHEFEDDQTPHAANLKDGPSEAEAAVASQGLPPISDETYDAISADWDNRHNVGSGRWNLSQAVPRILEHATALNTAFGEYIGANFEDSFPPAGIEKRVTDSVKTGVLQGTAIVLNAYRHELGDEKFAALMGNLGEESLEAFSTTLKAASPVQEDDIRLQVINRHTARVGTNTRIVPEPKFEFRIKTPDGILNKAVNEATDVGMNVYRRGSVVGAAAIYEALSVAFLSTAPKPPTGPQRRKPQA